MIMFLVDRYDERLIFDTMKPLPEPITLVNPRSDEGN
jgi:hypothetical protein